MPRLMSVALTEQAVRDRTKTVTRRLGWRMLKPGDRLTLCRKVQGRKPGEPLERICDVEVESVVRVVLCAILRSDIEREGFPEWAYTDDGPERFIDFFCSTHNGCEPDTMVTRIQWRYID